MEGKHMMPDGRMMGNKEMKAMMKKKKKMMKPSKKNYSTEAMMMAKKGM